MAIIALQSAATGLSALSTELDVTSNNLANVNTSGFKGSRVNFQDLLYQEKALPGVENANGDQRPTGVYVGLGTRVSGTQVNFSQGATIPTDREYDIAIQGDGFFRVGVEDDRAEGGIAYTRLGALTRNANGDLVIAGTEGRLLDPPVNIPEDATAFQVQADGTLWVSINNQPAEQIGQLQLADFINPQGLKQIGENLFAETAASGNPIVGFPTDQGFGSIAQRQLEASNVDPTMELIQLIRTQRAFEMNSQTIRAADDTLRAVAQLRQ
jgi:flagellar basal-body rod protein FlgG